MSEHRLPKKKNITELKIKGKESIGNSRTTSTERFGKEWYITGRSERGAYVGRQRQF